MSILAPRRPSSPSIAEAPSFNRSPGSESSSSLVSTLLVPSSPVVSTLPVSSNPTLPDSSFRLLRRSEVLDGTAHILSHHINLLHSRKGSSQKYVEQQNYYLNIYIYHTLKEYFKQRTKCSSLNGLRGWELLKINRMCFRIFKSIYVYGSNTYYYNGLISYIRIWQETNAILD